MSIDSNGNSGEQVFVPKGMRASQGTGIGGGSRKAGFAYAIRCRFGKPRLAPDQGTEDIGDSWFYCRTVAQVGTGKDSYSMGYTKTHMKGV